jgi:hypothetical protein
VLTAGIVLLFIIISLTANPKGSPDECNRILSDNVNRAAEGRLRQTDTAYYDVKCR